ncbi:MAG: hypothetical protein GF417_12200 [Candidatus Latescibacteria bacterium]|nr:hypothetical protein [bacterium]MBD3425189.1 hypothetical protein [Candidatus Latescibacterota bacterium]
MKNRTFSKRGHWSKQFLRYVMAGTVIFFLGMGQYQLLYTILPEIPYHATVAWILNFLLGTLWTHAIHRYYTFRESKRLSYFVSLLRTYIGYAGIQLIGSVMMLILVDIQGVNHLVGWSLTMLLVSLLNFLVMRHFSIVSWENS